MDAKEVRFGILGCGRIGARHAEKLKIVKDARLVGVFDAVPELKEKLSTAHGVKSYEKLSDFLADPEIDFVNICTPSGMHPEHAIAALQAKKHVICEKPMAFLESDAVRMIEAAKKNDRYLFVVKQNRFNPPVELVTKLLREGSLGKPIECVVNMFWNRNDDHYKRLAWHGKKDVAGGTLYTLGSHFVDLVLAFMGEPKMIFARMTTGRKNIETEDTGIIISEFKNGGLGAINYTACVTNKNLEGALTLICEKGTIRIGGEYLNTLDDFQLEGVSGDELQRMKKETNGKGAYEGSSSNHDKVFQAIVDFMNGEPINENLVSGETALSGVRFMEKAYQSAKTNEVVHFG